MRSYLPVALIGICHGHGVTPIGKVLDLMNGLLTKGNEAKHQEEVQFNAFHQWCEDAQSETKASIQNGANQIVQLSADIEKAGADAEELAGHVAELETSIGDENVELKAATSVRKTENADYKATHADLSESITAIARAIQVLKAKDMSKQQASLLQIQNMARIPAQTKATIASFLSLATNAEEGPPEAYGYEFQSGSVITVLQNLKHKFEDQRVAVQKAEIAAKSNYQLLAQKLTDNIKYNTKSAQDRTQKKAGRLSDAAAAKGELAQTETTKAADDAKLTDTLAECAARSDEFEKNQVIRAAEIKAISQAVDILGSASVSGHAAKHLPVLMQNSALAQLRSTNPGDSKIRQRVVEYLQSCAKKSGSRYLAFVANRATEDPFGKVKKMIKDLIVKLMEEANAEADHKGYCDTELATNKQTREIKTAEVDDLAARIEKNTADIAQLSQGITTLSDEITEVTQQQAEASNLRAAQKATNIETIADAKEAQAAVERAMHILKEFYASDQTALLQKGQAKAPYTGMAASGGNIIDFLDVILSNFARLESETSTDDDQQAAAHERFMNDSNQDNAVKTTAVKHKTRQRDQIEELTRNLKKELSLTQQELDAALNYYDKLKPDCVDQGLSYEARVANRKSEIESLQEAVRILNGDDLA